MDDIFTFSEVRKGGSVKVKTVELGLKGTKHTFASKKDPCIRSSVLHVLY